MSGAEKTKTETSKAFKIVYSVATLAIGALSMLAILYVGGAFSPRPVPKVSAELDRPDLSFLDEEILKQIKYVPVNVGIIHVKGTTAKGITLRLNSDKQMYDFVTGGDEKVELSYDETERLLSVNVPQLRPKASVYVKFKASADSKITRSTLLFEEGEEYFEGKDEGGRGGYVWPILVAVLGMVAVAVSFRMYSRTSEKRQFSAVNQFVEAYVRATKDLSEAQEDLRKATNSLGSHES